MALKRLSIILFLFSANLFAQTKPTSSSPAFVSQQKEIANLQSQVIELQKRVDALDATLKWDEYLLSNKQDRHDSITLNLTEHTFQRLDTDTGFFLISVEEVVPYLNGYKLRLKIGNPSSADYAGPKITVKWNKQYPYDKYTQASFEEWQKAGQEKDASLTDILASGSWNKVEVIIAPATVEQLGFVTLTMSTDTVRLLTK